MFHKTLWDGRILMFYKKKKSWFWTPNPLFKHNLDASLVHKIREDASILLPHVVCFKLDLTTSSSSYSL